MDVSLLAWGAVLVAILAMLAVDLFLHRDAHEIPVREAATWTAIWVAIGVLAGGVIWAVYGAEFGQQYFAGYVIEKSLAIDNVFVWAIIFSYFAVPLAVPAPRALPRRARCPGLPRDLHRRRLRAHRVVRLGALRLRGLPDLDRLEDVAHPRRPHRPVDVQGRRVVAPEGAVDRPVPRPEAVDPRERKAPPRPLCCSSS